MIEKTVCLDMKRVLLAFRDLQKTKNKDPAPGASLPGAAALGS